MIIPLAFTIVTGTGQAVVDELSNTFGGTPDRIVLATPGQIAWDKCDCGLFAQTIINVASAKTSTSPASDSSVFACGHPLMIITVSLQLLRCIPGPTDVDPMAPSPESLVNSALIHEEDRTVVRRSLFRHLKSLFDEYKIRDFTIGSANSVGPEGLCGGVEITYTFALDNDAVCD